MPHKKLILLPLIFLAACGPGGDFGKAKKSEKLGRYSTAISQYEDYWRLHSRDSKAPEALFRIGEIYRTVVMDFPKARTYFGNVKEWYPQSKWAESAAAALMNCPDYFPLDAGVKTMGDSQSGGENVRMTETFEPAGAFRAKLKRDIFAGETKVSSVELEYEKKDGELREFSQTEKSAAVILKFPAKKGMKWDSVRDGKKIVFTVEDDRSEVQTNSEKYLDCLKVREQIAGWDSAWKLVYYAPNRGVVLVSNASPKLETRNMEILPATSAKGSKP